MRLLDYGIITSNANASWAERSREVVSSISEVLLGYWREANAMPGPIQHAIAVEFPGPGVSSNRNVAYLPRYGVAVGWVMAECFHPTSSEWGWVGTPTASEWSKAIGAPGTKGDKLKTKRQEYVRRILGVEMNVSATRGGDVADAILIAHWAAREARLASLRAGNPATPLVVAFDPSITSTGYAILEGDR